MVLDTRVVFHDAGLDLLFESTVGPIARDLDDKAAKVATAAKSYVPVRTGFLRDSIYHLIGIDGGGLFAEVGATAHYARFVEFGTRFMAAQPFLRPAINAGRR